EDLPWGADLPGQSAGPGAPQLGCDAAAKPRTSRARASGGLAKNPPPRRRITTRTAETRPMLASSMRAKSSHEQKQAAGPKRVRRHRTVLSQVETRIHSATSA